MRKWKYILCIAFFLALLTAVLPRAALAAQIEAEGTCGSGLTWVLTDDGLLTISGTGAIEDYHMDWKYHKDILERVVIEEGVTAIGTAAFRDLKHLTAVELPESLQTIGKFAFSGCSALRSITIPAAVTQIKGEAFGDCTALDTIVFEGSAPDFGAFVFYHVTAIVTYPAAEPSWDRWTMGNYGGELTWISDRAPVSLELIQAPANVLYAVGDAMDLRGIQVKAVYDDGSSIILGSNVLTVASGDTAAVGERTVAVSFRGMTVSFPIYVHASRRTVALDRTLWPESAHPYINNLCDLQSVTYRGASSLMLNFSCDSRLAPEIDDLTLLYPGSEIHYRLAEMTGKTVVIPGGTVQLRMITDALHTDYGYSMTGVTADVPEHTGQPLPAVAPTCTADGFSGGVLCDICGLSCGMVLPASGHRWSPWQMGADGLSRTCSVCNETDLRQADRIFTESGGSGYEELTAEQLGQMYSSIDWQMQTSYETAPSIRPPYVVGRLTDACQDNLTLQANFFRRLARLHDLRWTEDQVESAQAGALSNAATDTLTHFPDRPFGMDNVLYDFCCTGALESNLAIVSGLMQCIPAWMDSALGHRSAILNSGLTHTGFGAADAADGTHYFSMQVSDPGNSGSTDVDFVAYPGGNRIYPREQFSGIDKWEVVLDDQVFQKVSPYEVQVTLVRESDGREWLFSSEFHDMEVNEWNARGDDLGSINEIFMVIETRNGLAFLPSRIPQYDGLYHVVVTGLKTLSGESAALFYSVDFRSVTQPDAHEHTPELRDALAAGCETPGSTGESFCTGCGRKLSGSVEIPALGHALENGSCIRCGHQDTLTGDLDVDGDIDSDDAIHLLYHTLFGDLYPVSQNCDYDRDGAITSDDAVYLLYHTLFGESYPLS